jgi:hypothetical protein
VLDVEVPGTRLVFWAEPGIASALDSGAIPAGQDVGATGVFVPVVDGRQLTFERTDDGLVDRETAILTVNRERRRHRGSPPAPETAGPVHRGRRAQDRGSRRRSAASSLVPSRPS